jgi:hypothetical protein
MTHPAARFAVTVPVVVGPPAGVTVGLVSGPAGDVGPRSQALIASHPGGRRFESG